MLSKAETEFMKHPEKFEPSYAKVLRHRVNSKMCAFREEINLLENMGVSVTPNRNQITEISNYQQTPNNAVLGERPENCGAPAGIRTRVFGSKGRNT